MSKRDIDRQPLEINELLSDVVLLVRTEVRRRGIRVETKPGDDVPLVLGDKVHLQQVLLNLFLNGMDAMANVPGERRLTVRTGVNGSGSVEIAVSDTGPGILPDRLPRLGQLVLVAASRRVASAPAPRQQARIAARHAATA